MTPTLTTRITKTADTPLHSWLEHHFGGPGTDMTACPHLQAHPNLPAARVAWAPTIVTCVPCARLTEPDAQERFVCDRCGTHTPGDCAPVAAQVRTHPPLLVAAGLCRRCRGDLGYTGDSYQPARANRAARRARTRRGSPR